MLKNKEKRELYMREYNKKWHENNRKKKLIYNKKYYREYGKTSKTLFSRYKTRAKKYGYSFNLSFQEFEILIKKPCVYCGDLPNPFNGIDRKDNFIGYELFNSSPCCYQCNTMKLTFSIEEFTNKCIKIVKNLKRNENL